MGKCLKIFKFDWKSINWRKTCKENWNIPQNRHGNDCNMEIYTWETLIWVEVPARVVGNSFITNSSQIQLDRCHHWLQLSSWNTNSEFYIHKMSATPWKTYFSTNNSKFSIHYQTSKEPTEQWHVTYKAFTFLYFIYYMLQINRFLPNMWKCKR